MNRRVPVFATWLLHRFGVQRQNEALMGDLAEEYQAGKSRLWYWWQTLVAIWVTAVRDVREHKLLALRALTMAWALGIALGWLHQKAVISFIAPYYSHGDPSPQMISVLRLVNAGYLWLETLLFGWLIARAHRAHAAALVLMVAASRPFIALAYDIYYSVYYSSTSGFYFSSGIFKSFHDHPEWILFILLNLAVRMVLILAGGLLVRPKIGPEQPPATIVHAAS